MRLEERVNANYNELSKTDFTILNYLIANKQEVVYMSVEKLSSLTYVSGASIVRFAKKLNFSGFAELKYFIKEEIREQENTVETSTNLLKMDIEETIKLISHTNLYPICESISKADRIFSYGTDWGERISSDYLVRNFMAADVFIHAVPSLTEINWLINKMNPNDLVIIFSYSGERPHVTDVISQLKIRNVPVISVTPLVSNFLSSEANYQLYYKATQLENDPDSVKEYNFFTTLNVLIDFLFRYYYDNFYN